MPTRNTKDLSRKTCIPKTSFFTKTFVMRSLPLFVCLCCNTALFAQAYIGDPGIRNIKQPAAIIRLPYDDNSVEDALKQYMMTQGYKSTGSGGFILFRSSPLVTEAPILSDLYFKTNSDRIAKDITLLNLIPVPVNQDIKAAGPVDSGRLEKARLFLDSLGPFISSYQMRLQINGQQKQLAKAQQQMNDLRSDSADLQKKIRDFQSDLAGIRQDQIKATADLNSSINSDDNTKSKYQKRVNKLFDKEASIGKKLRRALQDLEDNKHDISRQQEELSKQQHGLNALNSRYTPN